MCKLGHVLEASFRKQNSYKKIQNHVDPSAKRTSNITDYGVMVLFQITMLTNKVPYMSRDKRLDKRKLSKMEKAR